MIKFSRQRESIKNNLMGRTDHPTAETVYSDIRQEYPNISLGTVYRNLSLLADLGEIQKISTENGPDRFDGNPKPHYHFFCTNCNSVLDLKMKNIDLINVIAAEEFAGLIEGHITRFYGLCPECKKLLDKSGSLPDKSTNFAENKKEKHSRNAKNGWYRYDVRFAIPVYENDVLVRYNVFGARLLINHAENGKNIYMIF